MNNVAVSLADLEMHDDALVLKEETLKFRQRILPEDHPDIGAACCRIRLLGARTRH
jgi:hypothetical protein